MIVQGQEADRQQPVGLGNVIRDGILSPAVLGITTDQNSLPLRARSKIALIITMTLSLTVATLSEVLSTHQQELFSSNSNSKGSGLVNMT